MQAKHLQNRQLNTLRNVPGIIKFVILNFFLEAQLWLQENPAKKFSCEVDAYADLTLEFYPIAPETPENSGFSSFTQDTNPKKSDVFLEIWSFKPRYSDFVLYVFLSLLNILVYFIFTFNQRTKL